MFSYIYSPFLFTSVIFSKNLFILFINSIPKNRSIIKTTKVVATVGTTMMDGTVIRPGKLLGEVSNGMCCSPRELGIKIEYPPHHLLELEEDKVEIGQDFFSLCEK